MKVLSNLEDDEKQHVANRFNKMYGEHIDIYQYLTRHSISQSNIPNFHRQLAATKDPLLVPCEGELEDLGGRGHAPAMLYRRNPVGK